MSYLSIKQRGAILNLKSESKDKRLAFYTYQDTKNFSSRHLLTEEEVTNVDKVEFKDELLYFDGKPLNKDKLYCIDFETTGVNPYKDEIKILGVSDGNKCYYLSHSFEKVINALTAYKVIAYNIQFEHQFIYVNFGIDFEFHHDPMLMAYVLGYTSLKLSRLASDLLGRFPKSLEEIAGRKFTSSKPFSWEEDAQPYFDEIAVYCCEDCYETILLCRTLINKLNDKLYNIYKLDLASTHVASRMSLRGVRIDSDKLPQLKEDIEDYIAILQSEIENGCGWYANPKSPKQMNELLFNQLGLDTSELKKTQHGYSVDATSRQLLLNQHPVVKKYDYIAKLTDALNKYVNKMQDWIQPYDDKVHTHFNTCSTATGRLSSSDPNLQNIPNPDKYVSSGNEFIGKVGKGIRNLFIPSNESNVLIACDYSSFELKILAHLSQDETLIEVFKNDNSLHNVMTELLFNIEYDPENPDHKSKRTVVKTINFGLCYGMTWLRLYQECKLRGMNWSQNDCKRIINDYWSMLPTLAKWFERIKLNSIIKGYTETMFGRRRYYPYSSQCVEGVANNFSLNELEDKITPNDAEMLRQAGNHVIQGTNADTIRIAMRECDRIKNTSLILQIHDELVFETHEQNYEQASEDIKRTMESCIDLCVPVVAEPKVAKAWGECK